MPVIPPTPPPLEPWQTASLAPGVEVVFSNAEGGDIAWALAKLAAKRPTYTRMRDYYEGRHRLGFSTEKYREAFAAMVRELRANLCPAVVSALTDKLELVGFEPHEGMVAGDNNAVAADKSEADQAWALWEDEGLSLIADQVHEEAPSLGDAYVIVWPDEDGKAAFYVNDAAEVCVRYNVERKDRIDVAAKLWRDGDHWRLTLYYADKLLKFRTKAPDKGGIMPSDAKAFAPYAPEGEGSSEVPNPYGVVPVFHFPANGRQGCDGISDLADVIPIQDMLNKTLADLLIAGEFGAYMQRWATGIEAEREFNETTGKFVEKEIPFKVGINRIITVANAQAKFGQFNPTDLDKFIGVVNAHFSLVGRIKGIPAHYFYMVTGDFPSGEAQRTAEGRLVKRAERLQRRFGAVWARVLALALHINKVGDGKLAFTAKWASAEPRAESEMVTNFKTAIDGGMPIKTAAQKFLSMSEEEIGTMMDAKSAEDEAALQGAQDAFTRSMDKGAIETPKSKTPGAPAAGKPQPGAARGGTLPAK